MELDIIEAIVLGTLFGFALYKIGAGDPDKLMGMLKLQDLHLAKTILGGIGFATIILFTGVLLGLVPMEHFSIKGIYWGVIFGAIIFGLGWAISGFCPGTGMVGMGAGRIDAYVYFIGGLLGTYIFAMVYGDLTSTFLYTELFEGVGTLVQTENAEALFSATWSPFIAIIIGFCFLFIGYKLPYKLR